ncbi:MAG TPA: phosphatidate cytidylyltransferase [Paludibacteraceae bacterium]|nr:phosphatidate cytidylyltransferase [Paludibacteraceae bacterium]
MFKNILIRSLSGAVFVALMIAAIMIPPYFFGGLFLVITFLGLREFYSLVTKMQEVDLDKWISILGGLFLFMSVFLDIFFDVKEGYGLYVLSASVIFILELFLKKNNPIKNISLSLMGHFYIALPLCAMALIEKGHPIFLLAFFCMIWASDTGAYLTGMCFGKHKMFERVSPKKTWEGLFGGFVFALLVGFIFFQYVQSEDAVLLNLWQWLGLSTVVFIFGTLGDLVESLFKRTLNVKDSGAIMPGHGGVLDRFDSALLAAPVASAFLFYVLR